MDNKTRYDAFSANEIKSLLKWTGAKGHSNSNKTTLHRALEEMVDEGPPLNSDSVSEVNEAKQFLTSLKMNPVDPPSPPDGWQAWLVTEQRRRESEASSKSEAASERKWYRMKHNGVEVATIRWVSPAHHVCKANLAAAGLNEDEITEAKNLVDSPSTYTPGYTWVELLWIDKEFKGISTRPMSI